MLRCGGCGPLDLDAGGVHEWRHELHEGAGVGRPRRGVAIEAAVEDIVQAVGQGPVRGAWKLEGPCWRRTRDELVEHGAQGVDVSGGAGSGAFEHLGRHVGDRAGDAGEAPRERQRQAQLGGVENSSQAEVTHQHALGVVFDEDVGWLQVAMDHAAVVGVGHGVGDGGHHGHGLLPRHLATGDDQVLGQVTS